jgi:N-methylhydantoinase A
VPFEGSVGAVLEEFLRLYAQRYSAEAVPDLAGIELVTFVVEARGRLPRPRPARYPPAGEDASAALLGARPAYDTGREAFVDTAIYDGPSLRPDNRLAGPAIVEYPGTTVAVLSGQEARVDELLGITIRGAW